MAMMMMKNGVGQVRLFRENSATSESTNLVTRMAQFCGNYSIPV